MSKFTALKVLGEMAKGGGNYFGQIELERRRNERLAQARAEREAMYERRRQDQLTDLDRAESREDAQRTQERKWDEADADRTGRQVVSTYENAEGYKVNVLRNGDHVVTDIRDGDWVNDATEAASSGDDLSVAEKTLKMRMEAAMQGLAGMRRLRQEGYDMTGPQGFVDEMATKSAMTNWIASSEGQQYQVHSGRVKEPLLRTATGAAAPEGENQTYIRMYIPRAGDSDETVIAKERAIAEQIQNMWRALDPDMDQEAANELWRLSAAATAEKYGLTDPGPEAGEPTDRYGGADRRRGPPGGNNTPPGLSPNAQKYLQ